MRTSIVLAAGFVALASAGTTTITDTVDVTITSCEPTVTNCPYKGGSGADSTWSDWSVSASTTSSPAKVTSTSGAWDPTWSDWSASVSSTSSKPVDAVSTSTYSGTWADWSATSSTPVSPASTTVSDYTWSDWESTTLATSTAVAAVSTSSTPVAAASTGVWSYSGSSTGVAPATFTGAANINAGSFALAGLAAAAALVIA
ncbi:hypothetical protein PV04_01145 [Phialophora macrospora]|uniref:Uncharacterized protein n=1 Tax=Phialophora macrospora TaxID=1851006 RepID=A0A0D2GKT2_9EURO|nr:hypothetical protein PV04_01145 [Phialophora macrospora]